jgi:hypothetical protein
LHDDDARGSGLAQQRFIIHLLTAAAGKLLFALMYK